MKAGPDQKYTAEFREAAVRQVLDGGRSVPHVTRGLEMSLKFPETLRAGKPVSLTVKVWHVRERDGLARV